MRKFSTWLLACTAGVAVSGAAYAQQSAAGSDTTLEEVIVTGSRVSNPNISSPTPVLATTQDELLRAAPSNVADALNQLPAFRGSSSGRNSNVGSSPTQGNYLNLRNLGPGRTLVLFDGMRVLPTNATGGVDTNVLPQLLISRVDVVTGGASAAYGSDAVAGVVNFVIDKTYEGIKGVAQGGISSRNDVGSYKFGLAVGKAFADDKLHIVASYEHYDTNGLTVDDRSDPTRVYGFTGSGTAANPYVLNYDVRFNTVTTGGIIKGGPLNNTVFLGGDQTKIYSGTPTGSVDLSLGGDGVPWRPPNAYAALRTDQAFARFQYDLAPNIRVHGQYSFAESRNPSRTVSDYRFPGSGAQITLFSGNPYLPTSVQAAMTAQDIPSIIVGRASLEIDPFQVDVTNRVGIVNLGADGHFDLGEKSFSWDVSYVRGRSTAHNSGVDSSNVRFAAAVDAVRDPSGNIVCRVTITNPGLYPGCVPANIVGPGSMSQAAVDYIRNPTFFNIRNKMDLIAANVRGDLFELPAGAVSIALGAEYREQSLRQTSDSDPAIPISTISTGVRGLRPTATINRTTIAGQAQGSVNIKEGYAEVAAPLLRDLPLIDSLDVNGAVRYTDYSTSGAVTTWKVGGSYKPFGDLRLRATLSRDIAAPNLFQLYSGAQVITGIVVDPHIGGRSTQALQITRGNDALDPERATTKVFGGVYSPGWLPGFNLSIDYYDIKIKGAITTRSGAQSLADCEASGGTAPICDFIVRPLPFSDTSLANAVTAVNLVPLNLAFLQQTGFDFETNYTRPLSVLGLEGQLILRGNLNYLTHLRTRQVAGAATLDAAGAGNANQKVRAALSQTFQTERVMVQLSQRYIGKSTLVEPSIPVRVFADPARNRYKPVTYLDLAASYRFGPDNALQVFLNIENLLDKNPPFAGPNNANVPTANPGLFLPTGVQYDIVGRYYTAGIRFAF